MKYHENWFLGLLTCALVFATPQFTRAQANVENPQPNSFQSVDEATVTVRTFGTSFLTGGGTLLCRVPHVPVFGFDTYIRWQQSLQNFAIDNSAIEQGRLRGS